MTRQPNLGLLLAIAYIGLCIGAIAYIVWAGSTGGGIELAGVLIVLLGLPWSALITVAVLALGSSSAWLLGIGFGLSCLVNAWLAYRLGRRLSSRKHPA